MKNANHKRLLTAFIFFNLQVYEKHKTNSNTFSSHGTFKRWAAVPHMQQGHWVTGFGPNLHKLAEVDQFTVIYYSAWQTHCRQQARIKNRISVLDLILVKQIQKWHTQIQNPKLSRVSKTQGCVAMGCHGCNWLASLVPL